jgi:eukaryotic-like serine/threonine-protein kinase
MGDLAKPTELGSANGYLYGFGQFVLDSRKRTLSRAESPVPLTAKAFDVLLFLAQHPNRLVTKEELLKAVWGDTFVEEGNLAQYISHLRKALGDVSEHAQLIVTIPRRGYQFTAEVAVVEGAESAKQAAAQVNLTERLRADASPPSDVPAIQMGAGAAVSRRKGGVVPLATLLLVLTVAALLAIRALSIWRHQVDGRRDTLAPTDTLVLADVDNRTSDPVFNGALNIALRYGLEQTPYLNLLGLDKTYATMGQLKLAPTAEITEDIARQICSKTNSKMVISDSIADAGNRYHLEIRAVDCGTGATLAEEGSDIRARNQVVHEFGATVARLRRTLGEPVESLARFNQPLEKALSASLEALQAGDEGVKRFLAGDPETALSMFQRAVELDPELAIAYEGIGVANDNLSHYDLRAASLTRAYQLRDRMTEKNRLNVENLYYNSVTGELDKSYSVLVRALELFPRDVFFRTNLSNTLLKLGQLTRAADAEDETARLAPSPLYFSWAASFNIIASRFKAAKLWLVQADALKFDSLQLRIQRLRLAFIEGDRVALDRIVDGEARGPNRVVFLRERARFEAQEGRFDSADRLELQVSKLSSDPEDISAALVLSALRNAESGRVIQARKTQDQALQSKLERNRKMVLALSLARSGRTDEANRLADEVSREAPLDTSVQKYLVPTVRAAVKLNQHDPAAAIDLLKGTVPYDLANNSSLYYLSPPYIRGLAYLESGDGRLAAGEFQKLIDNPGLCWAYITGPLARLQLGRAERLMGDNVAARKSYEEFLTIWKDADRDLPIYRQAKAEYAQLMKS